MKPITHYTGFKQVETLIGLKHETLGMLARSMLSEAQETLYAIIWKAHTQSQCCDNFADEITITTRRGNEVQTYTGFVSEFQLDGKYGWHLWLSDGKKVTYRNDSDESENDQLLWVDINREQVKVYEDED